MKRSPLKNAAVACGMALMWCSQLAWSQVAKTSYMSAPNHTWLHQTLTMAELPHSLTVGASGDFDGDGWEDLVVGDFNEMYVAWNSPQGLGPWRRIPNLEGVPNGVFWDKELGVMWLQLTAPDRIVGCRWRERRLAEEVAFSGAPSTLTLCEGQGVVALRRRGKALELLKPDGEEEVLMSDASELSRAWMHEPQAGERTLVVQEQAGLKLGMVPCRQGVWEAVSWWEDTALTQRWGAQVVALAGGGKAIQVMGGDHANVWFKLLDVATGSTVAQWRSSLPLGDVRFTWANMPDQGEVHVLTHNAMTHAIDLFEFDAATGEVLGWTALDELAQLRVVLRPDLDGDGRPEWIYPFERQNRWSVVSDWSEATLRWAWRSSVDSLQRSWEELGRLGQSWQEGLDALDSVTDVWMHRGALQARTQDAWWAVTANEQTAPPRVKVPTEQDAPHSHQLVIPFLEMGDVGGGDLLPGVAEVTPGQWHHVAFTRTESNATTVWFDGRPVFQGKSKDLNYYYNSLIVGGYLGTHWTHFGEVSVDQVTLSGESWSNEEVAGMWSGDQDLNPGRYTERWRFDRPDFGGERRNRPMITRSAPRLDQGEGKTFVTLDGEDDAMQTYLAVPQKGVSLSFFFRFNGNRPSRPHTVATLYGMFNTWFNVVWQPQSMLATATTKDGVVRTPTSHVLAPSSWPAGSDPVVLDGQLLLVDSSNRILREGPLGWEPWATAPPTSFTRLGHAWASSAGVHIVDEGLTSWRWSPKQGWTSLGVGTEEGEPSSWVSTKRGAFSVVDSGWVWMSSPDLGGIRATETGLVDVVGTPLGERVTFTSGTSLAWDPRGRPAGRPAPPWVKSSGQALWLAVGLLGMLGAVIAAMVAKRGYGRQAPTSSSSMPKALAPAIESWLAQGAAPLDAKALDDILSVDARESEETRRGRRSRFVREMNSWGQDHAGRDIVLREKDPHDRRRAVYVLDPEVASAWRDPQSNPLARR